MYIQLISLFYKLFYKFNSSKFLLILQKILDIHLNLSLICFKDKIMLINVFLYLNPTLIISLNDP
jgi:hypothetical protein